jgi:hypothetical protein
MMLLLREKNFFLQITNCPTIKEVEEEEELKNQHALTIMVFFLP